MEWQLKRFNGTFNTLFTQYYRYYLAKRMLLIDGMICWHDIA